MSEQSPGRYSRSVGGLVTSMVVIVLVVVAFVGLRSLVMGQPSVTPQRIDYLGIVADLQRSGFDPVYPAAIPDSWKATNDDYTPGNSPQWGLSMLTGQGRYVGVEQSPTPLPDLLSTYVDDSTDSAAAYDSPGGLATTWAGWTGADGDRAYSATVDGDTVLVFGTASPQELQLIVRSLTKEKLGTLSPTPTPGATETF